jgi:hypothetical protein
MLTLFHILLEKFQATITYILKNVYIFFTFFARALEKFVDISISFECFI